MARTYLNPVNRALYLFVLDGFLILEKWNTYWSAGISPYSQNITYSLTLLRAVVDGENGKNKVEHMAIGDENYSAIEAPFVRLGTYGGSKRPPEKVARSTATWARWRRPNFPNMTVVEVVGMRGEGRCNFFSNL